MSDVGEYTLYVFDGDDGRWGPMMQRLSLREAIEAFRKWNVREVVFIGNPRKVAPRATAEHLGYVWRGMA